MNSFIQTLRNIYQIKELRERIYLTLLLVLVYRIGSFIVLPGVDADELDKLQEQTQGGILGLLNVFSGGAFSNASIFALGIMPYISASIIIQVLGVALPFFQKLQKEGESGRRKMNQITRWLTIAVTGLQAPAYLANLSAQLPESAFLVKGNFFWISSVIILVSGTFFIMWLGEKITERGIGNGISLIIMIGIIANFPFAFQAEFSLRVGDSVGGLLIFIIELLVLFVFIMITILLVQGTRKIPIQFAKKVVGNRQYGGVRQYLPIKVNSAGVMPIIFAQALMLVPVSILGYTDIESLTGVASAMSDFTGFWYNFIFGTLIIFFTYFYTAITINPKMMADEMKRNGGYIAGVKPGKRTSEFLDKVISRITLPGSIFLAIVAVLPAIVQVLLGVNSQFALFFGGTSLLIVVGVFLDTLQHIESHLLNRHFDGLMKTGRIKGRSSGLSI